jgi:hypothetical protein
LFLFVFMAACALVLLDRGKIAQNAKKIALYLSPDLRNFQTLADSCRLCANKPIR